MEIIVSLNLADLGSYDKGDYWTLVRPTALDFFVRKSWMK
jgi:hypothetical protein